MLLEDIGIVLFCSLNLQYIGCSLVLKGRAGPSEENVFSEYVHNGFSSLSTTYLNLNIGPALGSILVI